MGKGHKNSAEDYIKKIRTPHERNFTQGPGPDTQGGWYHGPPKRWTGRGPTPARHIPWPEILRHHISVVEGHQRMVEMVVKHTVPDTNNWDMISRVWDISARMVDDSKTMAKKWVPPAGQREKVPINSSSASMYPGYSPADHVYGEAAQQYGQLFSEAKKAGEEVVPPAEYEVGQSKGIKRKKLSDMRDAAQKRAKNGSGSGSGSGSDQVVTKQENGEATTNGVASGVNAAPLADKGATPAEAGENGMPLFVFDTKPMKVDTGMKLPKRSSTPDSTETKKSKKTKTKLSDDTPVDAVEEDISAEVDAKLKEKAERKKKTKEKKRKRESGDLEPATAIADDQPAKETEIKEEATKPEKKKAKASKESSKEKKRKRDSDDQDVEETTLGADIGEAAPEAVKTEKHKEKKLKHTTKGNKEKKRKSNADGGSSAEETG